MDSAIKNRLEALLRQIQLPISDPGDSSPSPELQDVYTKICKLIFNERTYLHLWDEPVLSQLDWLFQVKPPELSTFGVQVAELRQCAQQARRVNDFFFQILRYGRAC